MSIGRPWIEVFKRTTKRTLGDQRHTFGEGVEDALGYGAEIIHTQP